MIDRFGVSRGTLREALRILESEGLVQVSRGAKGGAVVLDPETESIAVQVGTYLQLQTARLEDLFAARVIYEPAAARAIAERRDQAVLAALAQCVAAQEFCVHDMALYRSHEDEFRKVMLSNCGNPVLSLMGGVIDTVFKRHIDQLSEGAVRQVSEHMQEGVRAKRRIVDFMGKGDGEAAERAWRIYIQTFWDRFVAALGPDATLKYYTSATKPPRQA